MSSYCSFTDVQSRLTLAGLDWAVNRDGGDTITATEITAYVTPALLKTDTEIDAAIQLHYETSGARGNALLTYIARDIAVIEVIENGGRTAPDSLLAACKRAREQLEQVRQGQLAIPGLNKRLPMPCFPNPFSNVAEYVDLRECDDE